VSKLLLSGFVSVCPRAWTWALCVLRGSRRGSKDFGGQMGASTVAHTRRSGRRQFVAIALTIAVGGVTAARSKADVPHGWAKGLAGCDTSRPAVAHHAGQRV